MKRRTLARLLGGAAVATASGARARAGTAPVRVGVLNDQSGVFADYQGIGSVVAARMAAEDSGGIVAGRPIEVITADHRNTTDIGVQIARQWLDIGGVTMIADVPNSAIALAVADLVRQRNRVMVASGGGTSLLTGARCSPNTVQWDYDTWEVGHALARAVVAQGHRSWFFLTADYAFGTDLEASAADAVRQAGGRVVGSVRHPLGATDYSSFLVQAQGSGADVLALANGGGDTATAIKQAAEFGLTRTMTVVGPIVNINVIRAAGLTDAAGLLAVTPFYWDLNDASRAFAMRFQSRHPRHLMPNDMQAGVYAGTMHYLRALADSTDPLDGRAVVARMKAIPPDTALFGPGPVRADGRKVHPVYLMRTRSPDESGGPWDLLALVATIPAGQAFRPPADGHCPLVAPPG